MGRNQQERQEAAFDKEHPESGVSSKLSEETVSRMRGWSMVSKVTISTDLELSIGFENRRLI